MSVEAKTNPIEPQKSLRDRLKSLFKPAPLTIRQQSQVFGDILHKMQRDGMIITNENVQQFLSDIDQKGLNWQVAYSQYIYRTISEARYSDAKKA